MKFEFFLSFKVSTSFLEDGIVKESEGFCMQSVFAATKEEALEKALEKEFLDRKELDDEDYEFIGLNLNFVQSVEVADTRIPWQQVDDYLKYLNKKYA